MGDDCFDYDPGRVDKARLLHDRGYLLAVVCQHFQQVDTYHRGLITAAAFSRALEAVGLRYGQREVEDILQHCTITDDGYVHYKDLLKVVGPITPRAKQSTMKGTIFPLEEDDGCRRIAAARPAPASPPVWDGKAEEVRRVYSRWGRGKLSNAGFKAELRELGVPLTEELEHLLVIYGPSRELPFRKLMYALQIEENDGRRARNPLGHVVEPPTAAEFAAEAGQQHGDAWQGARGGDSANGLLRQAICDFVDGRLHAVAFRQQLRRCGVGMSSTLDRLIRTHECDNSVRFQDLARLLLLQDKREQMGEGSSAPRMEVPLASGAQTPGCSSAGGERACGPGCGGRPSSDLRYGTPPGPRGGGGYPGQAAHRGQRQDDVRSLLSHGHGGGRPRSAASSSHGHRYFDDTRSVASHQASEVSEACAYEDGYYAQPPFATTSDLSYPRSRPSQRPASATRASGHSGDIIGWQDRPEQEPPLPPPRGAGTRAEALMRWPAAEASGREEEPPSRHGKRYYGTPQAAGEAAPFGRTTDIGPPGQRQPPPMATPFGTDVDLGFRRPEEAGTDEYRCAVRQSRRAY